ncbi:hypothetical protein [Rhodosalinus sediminis]|uniref:hypothetical protein n=1 Tax=Rhodosalinus sediminis TaxID=1940533 RepID=UPI00235692F1|nr:hypothetical protein [Rhodosalinus sediminis]
MTAQIAHLYALGCLAGVFFEIAVIAGLPLGRWTQGGRHRGALPRRARLLAAAGIPVLILQALAILSAAGFPGLGWPRWTGWAALALTLGEAALARVSPSGEERAVRFPVALVMAGGAGYVMAVTAGQG